MRSVTFKVDCVLPYPKLPVLLCEIVNVDPSGGAA